MASVTFDSVSMTYRGAKRPAVEKLDLAIEDGEFVVLVGPSGCGKSTTLRILAGLEHADTGRVLIGDLDVTRLEPKKRDIAMVFQNYALYPHLTVADNIGFSLEMLDVPKQDRLQQVREAAQMLGLIDYLERRPAALSGGQRQRVAMARAIVRHPRVYLMDEPLSNLDAKLRTETRTQIAALQRRLGVTTVYVTHDQVEAMTMGDRVAVMKDGVLQQFASPAELYSHPVNVFVGGFMGSPAMSMVETEVGSGGAALGSLTVALTPAQRAAATSNRVIVGVRPEALSLTTAEQGIPAVVSVAEQLGADAYLYVTADLRQAAANPAADHTADFVVRVDGKSPPEAGTPVFLAVDDTRAHLFDAGTGERL